MRGGHGRAYFAYKADEGIARHDCLYASIVRSQTTDALVNGSLCYDVAFNQKIRLDTFRG